MFECQEGGWGGRSEAAPEEGGSRCRWGRATIVRRLAGTLFAVKIRDLVRLLEQDGWRLVRTRGSHRQFKHAGKPGIVTVAGSPRLDVPPGTLSAILKQAGLKR